MARFEKKFESATVEWPTPQELFDELNAEFGFTTDVAATNDNAKCAHYYTQEQDGLKQDWRGVCWMNPPYGRAMVEWLKKAIRETWNETITVCLIPARTNTAWWHDLCQKYGEVRFVRGRPKFGGADHGLPQPLAIVVFRGRPQL
jgi:phage N-6-adenine-methyltransferase